MIFFNLHRECEENVSHLHNCICQLDGNFQIHPHNVVRTHNIEKSDMEETNIPLAIGPLSNK